MVLWSVSGAERAAGGAASGSCYPREFRTGIREVRDSTIATRKSRQQAARFAFSRRWCLLAVVCGISRAEARTVTRNFEPLARKMTNVNRSHLMHSMTQGFILSDSQQESALKG